MATAGPRPWLFDAWSFFYDLPWIQRAVYRAPQDAVLDRLRAARCRTVLDVGCGTGLLAARVRRELPRARVVGCDFSDGMLHRARVRARDAWWVEADAGRLPFPSRTFDAVVSTEAFHWFPDKRAALAEFRRVLRPGGHLLLALVNPRFAAAGRIVHLMSRVIGEPFYWPTAREMRRGVEAAGFRVEEQAPLFRLPGLLLFPPVLTVATARARRRPIERHARRLVA
jgi:ubiquinone/menaquinone biosynthesis C-methylase UbiE